MNTAQPGDRVEVQFFRVRRTTSDHAKQPSRKTCEFTVGGGEVFASLSNGVVGMMPGETRRMTLQPREAYGRVRNTLIRHIPRRRFPKNMALKIGKRLTMVHGIVGRRRRVTIIEIKLESVLVDGNHPLAGQSIEIDVLLVSLVSITTLPNRKQSAD